MPELTEDEARERIEGVLKAAGITVDMWGTLYGDLAVDVTFPDGAQFTGVLDDGIECDGLSHQRG